jgi:translation initiation factor IF-3
MAEQAKESGVGTVERAAAMEGRTMTMILAPVVEAAPKQPKPQEPG